VWLTASFLYAHLLSTYVTTCTLSRTNRQVHSLNRSLTDSPPPPPLLFPLSMHITTTTNNNNTLHPPSYHFAAHSCATQSDAYTCAHLQSLTLHTRHSHSLGSNTGFTFDPRKKSSVASVDSAYTSLGSDGTTSSPRRPWWRRKQPEKDAQKERAQRA
jgi:hypothetical protein